MYRHVQAVQTGLQDCLSSVFCREYQQMSGAPLANDSSILPSTYAACSEKSTVLMMAILPLLCTEAGLERPPWSNINLLGVHKNALLVENRIGQHDQDYFLVVFWLFLGVAEYVKYQNTPSDHDFL